MLDWRGDDDARLLLPFYALFRVILCSDRRRDDDGRVGDDGDDACGLDG